MKEEIGRINQDLPNTNDWGKATAIPIQQWIERVINRIEHYKTQHNALLKEAMMLQQQRLYRMSQKTEHSRALLHDVIRGK